MGKSSNNELNNVGLEIILGMKIIVVCTICGVLVVFYDWENFLAILLPFISLVILCWHVVLLC